MNAQREIKFRVWEKNPDGTWDCWPWGLEDDFDGFVDWDKSQKETDANNHCVEVVYRSIDDMIFEQYTGLKDKNDREIYEGDIIKSSGVPLGVGGDAYHDVYAVVVPDKSTGGFCADRGIYGMRQECDARHFWRCEVVGNIHQNKELLK